MKTYKSNFVQVFLLTLWVGLAGCEPANVPGLSELNASYEEAIRRSSDAVAFAPGSAEEARVLTRLEGYFTDMTEASALESVADVYAPEGYLNDNIVGIFGAEKIGKYFAHAAAQSEQFTVEFVDVARSGVDYYVRWEMTVQVPALSEGRPVVSYGVSHFRFDAEGRVLLHRDFWDAATGMYEHLPYVGGLVRYVHGKLAAGTD